MKNYIFWLFLALLSNNISSANLSTTPGVFRVYPANFKRYFVIDNNRVPFWIYLQKGDITKPLIGYEAIVNAANDQLQGGAGVCSAIFNAAGWDKLSNACAAHEVINGVRCPVGQACITESFDLEKRGIKYIIHAVGLDCRIIKDPVEQDKLLDNTYINALLLADKYNIKTIAFPFISSGIYEFSKERACKVAFNAINNYFEINKSNTNIEVVSFVLSSEEDFLLFNNMIESEIAGAIEMENWFVTNN